MGYKLMGYSGILIGYENEDYQEHNHKAGMTTIIGTFYGDISLANLWDVGYIHWV